MKTLSKGHSIQIIQIRWFGRIITDNAIDSETQQLIKRDTFPEVTAVELNMTHPANACLLHHNFPVA